MPLTYSSPIAIVVSTLEEGQRIAGMVQSLGFTQHQIFLSALEAHEVCIRVQYPLFIIHNDLPKVTGLTLIQKLRATGNYGFEAHLLLVDTLSELLLPVLHEFNIKYVLPKPFHTDRIRQKFESLVKEENNLPPFEQEYRAALAAHCSGLTEMACDLAVKAMKAYGQSEKILILLGDIEASAQRSEEARTFYAAAMRINPMSSAAAHKIAHTYMMEKDFSRATELLNHQMRLNPLNIELLTNAGLSNFEVGNYDKAKEALGQVRALDVTNKKAGETLASVALKQGDVRGACEIFKSSHNEAELVQFLNSAGVKLSRSNDVQGAINMYLQCLEVINKSEYVPAIYYNLGVAYTRINDLRKAVIFYKKALEKRPDFQRAAEALARLESKKSA